MDDQEEFEAAAGETMAFVVAEDGAGQRLDVAVTSAAKAQDVVLSRTRAKSLIEAGCLTIDGAPVVDGNRRLETGEAVALRVPPAEEAEPQGEPIALAIVYEDDHLVVIDKPAGLVVHPAPGHGSGTLVNALIHHCGREPVGHRRRAPAGHRPPPRQGHLRPAGRGQDGRGAPWPVSLVRRPRPHPAADADLRRLRVEPARAAVRQRRCAAGPPRPPTGCACRWCRRSVAGRR